MSTVLPKVLCIDTRFRDNYYKTLSTDFHVSLPLRFKNVTSLTLTSAEIPCCFNTFSRFYKNNYFVIVLTAGPGAGVGHEIVIPDGQYTAAEAASTITALMADVPALLLAGIELQVVSPQDQRLVFISTSSTPFDLFFNTTSGTSGAETDDTPLQLKAGWTLGYRLGAYVNGHAYPAEGLFDPQTPRYVFLVVDDFNNAGSDFFISAFNSSILRDSILAKISINSTNRGDMLLLDEYTVYTNRTRRYVDNGVNIQKLRIQLLDEYGRIVDLNDMDYSITLQLECRC